MRSSPTVIISGCHSGPNPSSGLGIARSLRAAFPNVRLIGRDFSGAATGLHDSVFDAVQVATPASEVDLEQERGSLLEQLEEGFFLSSLDVEVRWLTERPHPHLLVPSSRALQATAKPAMAAHQGLPARVPAWVALEDGETVVHSFCADHGWNVWVKGPVHEARRARTWTEMQRQAGALSQAWSSGLFIQAHITGREASLAFAAMDGALLDAVWLEKRSRTPEGKVWSGRIGDVPASMLGGLRSVLAELEWTGGGELEFVRDSDSELWLIDWNPRFPAWIHGATIAGRNLPATLVAAAAGLEAEPTKLVSNEFVRVVIETAARFDLPKKELGVVHEEDAPAKGKHPSGMSDLWRRLPPPRDPHAAHRALPQMLLDDLLEVAERVVATPVRVLLPRTAGERFGRAASLGRASGIELAYSFKTNPDPRLLRLAAAHGLQAEAISVEELALACRLGWSAEKIHYNGPVPLSENEGARLGAIFADDLAALQGYLNSPPAAVIGVRLQLPGIRSRFGIPANNAGQLTTLVRGFACTPRSTMLGLSMHVAASEVGLMRWAKLARQFIELAEQVVTATERDLVLLNFGGGWSPAQFDSCAADLLPALAIQARARFGQELRVLIEPGKALAQPSMALLACVRHIRSGSDGQRQAILDAGISDVPHATNFPHRVFTLRSGEVSELPPGRDELFGPLCMEQDQPSSGVMLPADVAVGDLIAIGDCGAYDASMTYSFGRGVSAGGAPAPTAHARSAATTRRLRRRAGTSA